MGGGDISCPRHMRASHARNTARIKKAYISTYTRRELGGLPARERRCALTGHHYASDMTRITISPWRAMGVRCRPSRCELLKLLDFTLKQKEILACQLRYVKTFRRAGRRWRRILRYDKTTTRAAAKPHAKNTMSASMQSHGRRLMRADIY